LKKTSYQPKQSLWAPCRNWPQLFGQLLLSADYLDGSREFVWMLTSVVICEFVVATNDDLLYFQGGVFVPLGIVFDRLKNIVVEVYFARSAFDNDFTATV